MQKEGAMSEIKTSYKPEIIFPRFKPVLIGAFMYWYGGYPVKIIEMDKLSFFDKIKKFFGFKITQYATIEDEKGHRCFINTKYLDLTGPIQFNQERKFYNHE